MKVSGFTFVRNALQYGYPIEAAIQSILPICDEVVVCVGKSEDNTLALIERIPSNKIKIVHSVWDDSLREGGKVLTVETDKAFAAISPDSDWAFYIQGDEVVHEKYLEEIREAMQHYLNQSEVEGLLFKYLHFYGTYDYVGDSRRWYRNEVRVIRNDKSIYSYKDAQGFKKKGRSLGVKPIDAYIYHYGWVKHPKTMKAKEKNFHKLWHSDEWVQQNIEQTEQFDYSKIDSLKHFENTHPKAIQPFIERMNWSLDLNTNHKSFKWTDRLLYWWEQKTGKRLFEYRNYKLVK